MTYRASFLTVTAVELRLNPVEKCPMFPQFIKGVEIPFTTVFRGECGDKFSIREFLIRGYYINIIWETYLEEKWCQGTPTKEVALFLNILGTSIHKCLKLNGNPCDPMWALPTWLYRDYSEEAELYSRDGGHVIEEPGSTVKKIAHYLNGTRHGSYREFDRTGALSLDSNYHHGELHGTVTGWWYGGQTVESVSQYVNGYLHGRCSHWDRDGKLISSQLYQDGFPLLTDPAIQ